MEKNKNRNVIFDIARGICVIWIVAFWHIGDYIEYKRGSLEFAIGVDITTAVLACFTFMSGFFLRKYEFSGKSSIFLFYKKRICRFYLLLFLSATSLYVGGLIVHQHFYSLEQYLSVITGTSCISSPPPPTLWYFGMIILFYIVTPIIKYKSRFRYNLFCALLIFGVFYFVNTYLNCQFDERYLQYYPFYILGLFFPQQKECYLQNSIIGIIGGVVFAILTFCCNANILLFIWIKSAAFILFIILISKLISNCRMALFFSKISYASMIAYLFHRHFFLLGVFLLNYGSSVTLREATLPIWIAYLLVCVIFVTSYYFQRLYDSFCKNFLLRV